jgi:hypothetical protein
MATRNMEVVMMRCLRLLAVSLILGLPASLRAQDTLDRLSRGTAVRVAAPELGSRLQAGSLAEDRGCLYIRLPFGNNSTILRVPLHRLTRLEVPASDVGLLRPIDAGASPAETEWMRLDIERVRNEQDQRCVEAFPDMTPLAIRTPGSDD